MAEGMGLTSNLLHSNPLFSRNLELCIALHPLVMTRTLTLCPEKRAPKAASTSSPDLMDAVPTPCETFRDGALLAMSRVKRERGAGFCPIP